MHASTKLVGCALSAATALAATAPAAGAADVVISQVYGAGGNSGASYQSDYVELFNRSATPRSVDGWSVQYASATGTGAFQAAAINGTIAPGGRLLVKLASGTNGQPLPAPDQSPSSALNLSGTAGKVALADQATGVGCNGGSIPCTPPQRERIVDLVGYGTANFFEGTGPAPATTATTAAVRGQDGCRDSDDNATDFTREPAAPRNAASAPTPCRTGTPTDPTGTGRAQPDAVAPGASTLLAVDVTPGTVPPSTGITVTADTTRIGGAATTALNDAGQDGDATAGDGTYSRQVTVVPTTAAGPTTIPATIADAQQRTSTTTIALAVTDRCGDPRTPIHEVQGAGSATPKDGQVVTIEGVVVGDLDQAGGFDGFYLQEPDASQDDDPRTSEGVFVYAPEAPDVTEGDRVRVRGTATEFFDLTQVRAQQVGVCAAGEHVAPTSLDLPVGDLSDFERVEGMLATFPDRLTVNETFTLARYGEVRLAEGRLYSPTTVAEPGPAAQQVRDGNLERSFVLDDGDDRQNVDPTRYPQGGLSFANTLRSGSTTEGLRGVVDFRFGDWRVQPVGEVTFRDDNPRTDRPEDVGGNVKVASFNVLNFFNGPAFPTPRGASTPQELERQVVKEVSALKAIDADVVGLNELENDASGPDSAIAYLTDRLNEATAPGTYAYVDTGVIGTDEIRVALLYKPAKVTPVGPYATLTTAKDPRFLDTKNRPSLAQTFRVNASGTEVTVVANHLKSKGSACDDVGDPDTGDLQGNCNRTRTNAAEALADWLATNPTGRDAMGTLIVGDLNSYALEDPIDALKAAGYRDMVREEQGAGAYSYVFDGEAGYLDHALASSSLAPKVTGVTEWHIDADEPIALDYNTEFKTPNQVQSFYGPGPYRASDHDPVVVGLDLRAPARTTVTPVPGKNGKHQVPLAQLTVAETGDPLAGRALTFTTEGEALCTATTDAGGIAGCDGPGVRGKVARAGGYEVRFAGDEDRYAPAAAHAPRKG